MTRESFCQPDGKSATAAGREVLQPVINAISRIATAA